MKRLTVLAIGAITAIGVLVPGASGHSNPAPASIAAVGPLHLVYPSSLHRRYFSSCSYAVTGDRSGACVHGVVLASYPLRPNPELGGSGATFKHSGVLFELYRSPRQQPVAVRTMPPRLSLADFHAVGRGMHRTGEQRGSFFRAKGGNYWAIAWIGKHAGKSDRDDLTGVIRSIQLVK
jgi:hypothetical protein